MGARDDDQPPQAGKLPTGRVAPAEADFFTRHRPTIGTRLDAVA